VFEVLNGEENGYIAIDDVLYTDCADQSAGQSCGAASFTCDDGTCVFLDEVSKLLLCLLKISVMKW